MNGYAPPVVAPFYPQKRKEEGWWLVVGDPATNQLLSIKRYYTYIVNFLRKIKVIFSLTVNAKLDARLDFVPTQAGRVTYKLYFICDSYLGADQEFDVPAKVSEPAVTATASSSSTGGGKSSRKRRHEKEEDEK